MTFSVAALHMGCG